MDKIENGLRPHRQRKHAVTGFTLIELLIVIAIISILATILFPVFGRARENARRAGCQSNLKQLGLGVAQYMQDYDSTYPRWQYAYTSGTTQATWDVVVFPYTKSAQLLTCPSDSYSPEVTVSAYNNAKLKRSYTMPRNISEYGIADATVPAPAKTVLLAERKGCYNNGDAHWIACSTAENIGEQLRRNGTSDQEYRHLNTSNFLFFDGHVKVRAGGAGNYPRFEGYNYDSSNGTTTWVTDPIPQE
jgi:prepilin-type N-terminal cleavage/methylation domain-containing protein/prepilin-type processing-associated H-X9-DG protein